MKKSTFRTVGYMLFAIIILLSSWDYNRVSAAVIQPTIPQQSIRLRILANSDRIPDQAVKKRVRDAVVQQIDSWVSEPQGIDQARKIIRANLPLLTTITGQVLRENGFQYAYKVELGVVPFPTKMYGTKVYPAGNYEALRITLGQGLGQNWWCVLFPPLCFVDVSSGDAVAPVSTHEPAAALSHTAGKTKTLQIYSKSQVHFFIWDELIKIFAWIHSLFS